MATYYAVRGDIGSSTPASFLEDGDGNAVLLTGAAVRFLMALPGAPDPKVAAEAEIVDEDTGQVRYTWTEEDLDAPGVYRGEYEVTYEGGAVETFPPDGWITVVVRDDLDDEES